MLPHVNSIRLDVYCKQNVTFKLSVYEVQDEHETLVFESTALLEWMLKLLACMALHVVVRGSSGN